MWAKWDRGPLPGSCEEEGEQKGLCVKRGLEGETGPQEEGISWGTKCWPVPSAFLLTHDP